MVVVKIFDKELFTDFMFETHTFQLQIMTHIQSAINYDLWLF